ncbi:MarR family winged helix-turn-helix transcriptional regulator [Amycolatopsis cihanbeyliensis]|uniref:DNA-binding MarR family transcriptional regulator n=1 Tax=Amycolatopsis cihanbeyliensis TaxID=1128664 RepID=A0A542DLA7_AMYCI|nr:MarR family transcriptional regulator [Amycolatopsis cihanbeyliensis]TQJ03853.1 DNA-binding MarR family transcriptional regulator [Amycolatopsis cihanbeyliensis]
MSAEISGVELGRELSTAVVAFHEAVGARLGVRAVDQRALAYIGKRGSLSAGELAREIGLTPGAVTGMVDRLERAGLVHREPDPFDRRRVVISVAEGGSRAFAEAFAGLGSAMNDLVAGYEPAEQRVIADYLTRTIEVLRAQARRLLEEEAAGA